MNKELTIVMTTDENYILQTRVAIWTLLEAGEKDSFFNIYILCDSQLEECKREKIYVIQKKWTNVHISFKEINESIFMNAKTTSYIPKSSFYRILIPDIIEGDRCLFLDGDIIINTDLSEIYNIDLTGKYLAGVKDCMLQCNMKEYENYGDTIGIPGMSEYINAGVLLMNLTLMRDEDMSRTFISCLKDYYMFMDQDIMNKCCFGKIVQLDLKYNFCADYYKKTDKLKGTFFSQREIDDVNKGFGILHFPGKYKPWNCIRTGGADLWWKCAERALSAVDYEELYNSAVENTQKNDWEYILNRCKNIKDVIIIGFSDIGKDVADSLMRCGIENIKCFCDNNREKQLLEYNAIKVLSIDHADLEYPEALWINTSQAGARDINKQLLLKGIRKDSILVYTVKSKLYYENIDEQYREYEAKQYRMKQYGEMN